MSHADLITLPRLLSRLPRLLVDLPAIVKGLHIGNRSRGDYPVSLASCIEEAARDNPHGVALIQGDEQLSYAEFDRWANQLAHYLRAHGLRQGDSVALMFENRFELLAGVVACAKLGAVSALLNSSQRGRVLAHSISLASPRMVLVGEELLDAFTEIAAEVALPADACHYFADRPTWRDPGEAPAGWQHPAAALHDYPVDAPLLERAVRADDPCFYIYTSGTTGLPKAVVFNHGRFMKGYGAFGFAAVRLGREDRMYVSLPFYHGTAMVVCWGSVLAGQAALIMVRKFSASRFWDDVERHRATAFGYVGELCRYLLDQPARPSDAANPIRVMVGNGLRPSIWQAFKQRFAVERVVELYASSEGNIGFTNLLNLDNTVGFSPYPYAIVRYDQEREAPLRENGHLQRVAKGEAGLLLGKITDKSPFHGYTSARDTERCILRDVFEPGDAWFNTGDLMRDMGFRHAQFVDRLGDTFRWKGENVSTTQVEAVLDGVAEVSETVVYGVEVANTNGRAGMACIRLACAPEDFDFQALLTHLRQELPAYAVPLFLRLSAEMETTGTFKHKKAPLKEQAYDLEQCSDPLYAWLPGADRYVPLTRELQVAIAAGHYRY
ncbi:MAG: long-chain-acyl-CoA synthetase [Pseudomonas sp.]|uniref:long-chain-acyl-CoA synthetase n=1 Tax=Pseudomonas sp. TaxID=306 RepID=UPI0027226BD7|nr:long-chain-acyl-CoA synthetase [Pseudomonas sp.]MDO9617958.1 long-chain-acyl-CoA synthetase [Pseudomonas sp.]MDP2444988.1 long-chain-acyl-CoA synthetase [Pseudomonas sp.]MDZ4332858.1 long-chain-acyl-CoA synthetase [Pseudomonas sp.]